jgi:hypothetical protein
MKGLLPISLAALTLATACKKDDDTPAAAPLQVTGTFSGANETPAVTTSATGNVSATYNKATKTLTYTVTYVGLKPTMGHFHIGAPGVAGPVVITYPYLNYSPISGSTLLSQVQEDALLAGNMYANLHTATNQGGEIRANLVAK